MEKGMAGSRRREKLLELMGNADGPISGSELGAKTGVSRQIVVQDIVLLRTEGHPVVSTARGYYLEKSKRCTRLFKVCHTNEQVEDELLTIVDLGGCVVDVMVNHRVYGKVSAPLEIKNRRDVQTFVNDLKTGKSTPLLNLTSGYHFHHITADTEEILDEIEAALRQKNYIAKFLQYEKECLTSQ